MTASVDWYGSPTSWSAAAQARTETSDGYEFDVHDRVWDWVAGQTMYHSTMTSDGTLLVPSQPFTTNAYQPTGDTLAFARWVPPLGALASELIPTSTGVLHPRSLAYPAVGGADFEDAEVFFDGATECVLLTVGRPYNDWRIGAGAAPANQGIYPCFVVLTKSGGIWTFDAARSKTSEQVRASNPTEAANIYIARTSGLTGESFTDNRNTNECERFPASGHLVVGHYDSNPTAGYDSGALSVVDATMALKAGYLVPNVDYPTGHRIGPRPRSMASRPDSAINDEEFAVLYDVFDTANPAGLLLDGATSSCATAPDNAAWNVAGVMDIALRVRLPDYTPAAVMYLMAHSEPTAVDRGWAFLINADGTLRFSASNNGSAYQVDQVSSAPSLTNGTEYWLGCTYNTATGALSFYKANAAEAMPTRWGGWTLISSHTVTAVTFFDATTTLSIGASGGFFSSRLIGVVYRAALYDDGTLIADANFAPDGSPKAVTNTATYTDSQSRVWTIRGTAYIDSTAHFMVQLFTYNAGAGTIVAKSQSFASDIVINGTRPTQVHYDEVGNLYVSTDFFGIFNATTAIYERAALTAFIAAFPPTGPWADGNATVTTTQWGRITAPTVYSGAAVGGFNTGMAWDNVAKVMYLSTGTAGPLAIQRSGAGPAYTYTYRGAAVIHSNDNPNPKLAKPVLDRMRGKLWLIVGQTDGGASYPPASIVYRDQWIASVDLNFWSAEMAPPVIPSEALLNGSSSERTEGVRWDVLDHDNNLIGTLMADRDNPAAISNDVTRAIRRTISSLNILPRPVYDTDTSHFYADDIDPLTMRIKPYWTYANGDAFPLGLFVFGDDSQVLWSWGWPRQCSLTDLMADLDQPLDNAVGYGQGTNVYNALINECDKTGIGPDERIIESTTAVIDVPVGWVPGRDTQLVVFDGLCKLAGFLPPYRNNDGVLVCRSSPDLASATATYEYGANTVVLTGTAVLSSDILTAPNRYVVVGSNTDTELVGIFDVPDSAPHSYMNIGRYRRKSESVQGLTTQAQADAAAAAAYVTDSSTYSWLGFDTPVDPRHDTWDILSFDGVNYRQLGWTIECRVGGTMRHSCRGAYL